MKNLWRNRGYLEHGLKDCNKNYFTNELKLLLNESPSVCSKYRDVITKNDNYVLFCLNKDCNTLDEFIETLFWADLYVEQDEDGNNYIIDYNKSLVLTNLDFCGGSLDLYFKEIKKYGGLMVKYYYDEQESIKIIDNCLSNNGGIE